MDAVAFALPAWPATLARTAAPVVTQLNAPQVATSSSPARAGLLAAAAATMAACSQGRRPRGTRRQAAVIEEVGKAEEKAEPAPEAPEPPPKKKFDARLQVGVGPPLDFFDPAGFCPINDEQKFRQLRGAELKHGRVAMLAAVGQVLPCYAQFPGFTKVPPGITAAVTGPGLYGTVAIFLFAGALEIFVWKQEDDKEPGNFGDPLGLMSIGGYNDFWREVELNNGRGAMFAAAGIIAAELASGRDAQDQLALIADFVPFF